MTKKIVLMTLAAVILLLIALFFAAKNISMDITVQRVFAADPDRVWALWTDAESMKKWWSPKDFTAPTIKQDFVAGGSYLWSMKAPDGKMFWNTGRFIEIVPLEKIVATQSFADENGAIVPAPVPGNWPKEVVVTIEFDSLGTEKTLVTVHETGIPAIMYLFAKLGWEQQFDKFEGLLK